MKKTCIALLAATALAMLFGGIGGQTATADDGGDIINILIIVGDETGGAFHPIAPLAVSLDFGRRTVKVINFCIDTRILAVTREIGEAEISMAYLSHCDTEEIVRAYENTFGLHIDRYLLLGYQYGSFAQLVGALDMLCPVTLDIPEILLGNTPFSTVNGNMPMFAGELNREYTLLTGAQAQELDTVGLIAYFAAAPAIDIGTVDWNSYPIESYRLWDAKCRAVLEAVKPAVAQMGREDALAFWTLITQGHETNLTGEDIARWSEVAFTFPDACYLSVPGLEDARAQEFDASAFTSFNLFAQMMLVYDDAAVALRVQAFISGE